MVRRFFRIAYYAGIALIFVLVALVGYTQTRSFRTSLQNYILSHYHSILNGELSFSKLEGNLITGIRLYNVTLRDSTTILFTADRIEISHEPLVLFFKRVSLGRVSIINPRLRLTRSIDGSWNVSKFIVASSDTNPSPWAITAKNIELINARLTITDSVLIDERARGLRDAPGVGLVDYVSVTLDSLNVEGGVRIRPAETDVQLRLMTFTLENPRIHLKHLQGDFKLTKDETSVSNVKLVTERSKVDLDASLSKINIAAIRNLAELKAKPVNLNLQAENLDTRELKQFLYPWVDFLDKSFAIQVRASGDFSNLNVQKVVVETPQTLIAISGTIANLHRPKDLELDLNCTDSFANSEDVLEHLPGLSLPKMEALGKTTFRLAFKGSPTDFESAIKAKTEAGTITISGHLKINDVLEYKTTFVTNELDLGKLMGERDLTSRLNLNGTLTGTGTDLYATTAVARVELDSSEFWGLPLGQSAFVLDLNKEALRSHAQLRAGLTSYELSSVMKFPRGDSVSYTLNGSINSLNLADILKNDQFKSDLWLTLRAAGKGVALDRLNNSVSVSFLRSSFGEVSFEKGGFETSLNVGNSGRSYFSLRSVPLDMDVEGKFTMAAFVENIVDGEKILSEAIAHRFQTLDSLKKTPAPQKPPEKFLVLQERRPKIVDITYSLKARNLYPVGVFFQKSSAGSLTVDGTMKGSIDSLSFAGDAKIHSFEYRNPTDFYRFDDGMLSLNLDNISRTQTLSVLDTKLDARFGRFSLNKLSFYNTSLSVESHQDTGSYQWSALIDSTYQVDLRTTSRFASNVYTFDLSQLRIGMDFYILENNDPAVLKLGRSTLFIGDLALAHEVEELGIGGYFSPGGTSDLKVTVNDFLLNDLKSVLNKTKLAGPVKDLNGILNATLEVKGTMKDPSLALNLNANGFRSHDLVFGQVVARSSYSNHLLGMFVELRNRKVEQENKPDLLISGTVPFDLGLSRNADHSPQGEINLTMFSNGLNLEFLEPFIPAVSNLSGIMTCDVKIRGTVDDPAYDGSVTLQGAKLMFDPLGINFSVQGSLIPNGNRVGLQNFAIKNIPQDRSDGQMTLSGTFSLAGLKFQDVDLRADGQLLVMKESSRLAGQKIRGDLLLATGPSGVRWQGPLSGSRVSGDVLIKYGKLTLPPERETVSTGGRTINVIFRDDTSSTRKAAEAKIQSVGILPEDSDTYASLEPMIDPPRISSSRVNFTLGLPDPATEEKSFLDNIAYDLNIDVQSPTSLLFVFNTQPSEELFADLKGKLAFNKNSTQTRLTGEVSLESRSFYYFFKRFDASGKIDFTGNPLNPELNVQARYEGLHNVDTLLAGGAVAPKNVSGQKLTAERVGVLATITGTKQNPKVKLDIDFPDRDKNSQYVSKDPEGDAMSFLITGYLKDELDPQQRGSFLTANMLSSLTAGLITGPLTNALKKQVSAIQSVDLQYYGGDWNKTDVRVTAEISSAVIRFGGRVIEGINNTNVTVEVPVGSVVGSDLWRNLLLKYERKVDAVESIDQRTQSNSLSLFYRIIF